MGFRQQAIQLARGFNFKPNFYGASQYQTPESIPLQEPDRELDLESKDAPSLEAEFLDEILSPIYQD